MRQILKIITLLRPYWRFIFQSLLVGILLMFLQIPGPYITKVLIDDVYPQRDFTLMVFVLVLTAVFSISLGLTNTLSDYFGGYVGVNMGMEFKSQFYTHVQGLDFGFFDNRQTGEIIARFNDMDDSIENTIDMINSLIMNSLQLLIFPAILLYINWKLALISMAVLPFDTILIMISKRYISRISRKLTEALAGLSAISFESLSGIRTIQALGLEAAFYDKLRGHIFGVSKLQIRSILLNGGFGFIGLLIRTTGTFAYGWYGWTQILHGNLSLGSYMAFSAYVGYLYGPISSLIGLVQQLELTHVHINRFFEIYELRPEIRDRPNMSALPELQGEIQFNEVTFCYQTDQPVLRNIDLYISAKTTVALVGKSGSGKSTLAKLIPRFYDPQEGEILIDGHDIRYHRLSSLRRQVGFAMQGSTLFHGSILENLTFGEDIPLRVVQSATQVTYIDDFISSLPERYNTLVGEQGAQLSEGQKQRIALARVLLMNTPILILDEPTAALDLESEEYVSEALKVVQENRTTIIIAHRLSTIRSADNIVVIDEGQIIEQGTHESLIAGEGAYAHLYNIAARI